MFLIDPVIRRRVLGVKYFGAKGDGVADDTAAIQAAIDALDVGIGINDAKDTLGGVIDFPLGTYRITSELRIYGNIRLRGEGPGSRILADFASNDQVAVRIWALLASAEAGQDIWTVKNVHVEDLTIDTSANGYAIMPGASNSNLIKLIDSSFRRISIASKNWGMWIGGPPTPGSSGRAHVYCQNVTVDECHWQDPGAGCLMFKGNANQIRGNSGIVVVQGVSAGDDRTYVPPGTEEGMFTIRGRDNDISGNAFEPTFGDQTPVPNVYWGGSPDGMAATGGGGTGGGSMLSNSWDAFERATPAIVLHNASPCYIDFLPAGGNCHMIGLTRVIVGNFDIGPGEVLDDWLTVADAAPIMTILRFVGDSPGALYANGQVRLLRESMRDEIEVHRYATGGNGTAGTPWTGWEAAVPWGAGRKFVFAPGYFQYAASPSGWIATDNFSLVGAGPNITFLKCTGSADVMAIRATLLANTGNHSIHVEGFTLDGSGTCANGLYVGSARDSSFKKIRVKNVTTNALLVEGGISCVFEQVRCLKGQDGVDDGTTLPTVGILIDEWDVTGHVEGYATASSHQYINCWIKGLVTGVKITHGFGQAFRGGASEGCVTHNLWLANSVFSGQNTFDNFDMEGGNPSGSGADAILVESGLNVFQNCNCPGSDIRLAGGRGNKVEAGFYRDWYDQGDGNFMFGPRLNVIQQIGSNPFYHNANITRVPVNVGP